MEITEVNVHKVNTEGSLKAYAVVTFDDCFVVHNTVLINHNLCVSYHY